MHESGAMTLVSRCEELPRHEDWLPMQGLRSKKEVGLGRWGWSHAGGLQKLIHVKQEEHNTRSQNWEANRSGTLG